LQIWISPITGQITNYTADLASYHGYWQNNLYELNANFGNVTDLQLLSKALHDRDMYLMVDIVVNDMAWVGNFSTVDYGQLVPFNNASNYHTYCSTTAGDKSSQTECWIGDSIISLPDLRTEDADIQATFQDWISALVTQYNIDGLRIDSVGNVEPSFFPSFCSAAKVYCIGEVATDASEFACPYQEVLDGILNYPLYFPLIQAFNSTKGSISGLADQISNMQTSCRDITLLGTFSENHDVPRFPSYTSDISLVKNVMAFTLLSDGIPVVYQGQEQHLSGAYNPVNREAIWLSGHDQKSALYIFITSLNVLRNVTINTAANWTSYHQEVVYNDSSTLVTRKGYTGSQIVTVLTNDGEAGVARQVVLSHANTGFAAGEKVVDILSCRTATVNDAGLSVSITNGLPMVFYSDSLLDGSTICVTHDDGSTNTTVPSSGSPTHKGGASGINSYSIVQVGIMGVGIAVLTMVF
jgi:alpha-amylase